MGVSMVSVRDHRANGRPARTADSGTTRAFGELSERAARDVEEASFPIHYPDAATLFSEGEPARGIFIVNTGSVKLFLSSGDGRILIVRVAKAGDILGLPGTISGGPYEVTAETLGSCHMIFIKRQHFLRLMNTYKEISVGVANQLMAMYQSACHEIRCVGVAQSSGEKLALLILDWPLSGGDTPSRIKFAFRHEEVAQMIGISRETVSRLFVNFKKKRLAELVGSTLYVRDRELLRLVADGKTLVSPAISHRSDNGESHPSVGQGVGDDLSDTHFYTDGV